MIAVTGATGNLGNLIVQHLLKKVSPSEVVALVRNPSKAEGLKKLGVQVRQADYSQPSSWAEALKGVQKLMLVSSSEVGQRAAQHQTVIHAAKGSGVSHIVYTSILKADTSTLGLATEHVATEKAIKESGLTYTVLRNGWYIENHTENLAPALEYGSINGAAGSGKFSSATRSDFALAAAQVLTTASHQNKTYELAGDTAFTLDELAKEVSNRYEKPIVYKNLSFDEYKNLLIQVGLPEGFAALLADSDVGAAKGDLFSESKDLHNLIGKKTTTLTEALKA